MLIEVNFTALINLIRTFFIEFTYTGVKPRNLFPIVIGGFFLVNRWINFLKASSFIVVFLSALIMTITVNILKFLYLTKKVSERIFTTKNESESTQCLLTRKNSKHLELNCSKTAPEIMS